MTGMPRALPSSAIFMSSTRSPRCTLVRSQSETERIMVTIHGLNSAAKSAGMPERTMMPFTVSYSVLDKRRSSRCPSVNMTSGADLAMTDVVAFSVRSETSSAIVFESASAFSTAGESS